WLGLTPARNGTPGEAAEWNQRSQDYNAALAAELDAFQAATPGVDLFRLDLAGLLNDLVARAEQRGFTNATDSAAPGLDSGTAGSDTSQSVPNPGEYMWGDGVHPTAAVHRLLGFEAIRAVLPPGDYDRDGLTTGADLAVWSGEFGSIRELASDGNGDGIVNGADYAAWRNSLQGSPPPLGVPEPCGVVLCLATAAAMAARRTTRA
ncbi:MAG: hypothetical protein AAF790_01260, partial [Planctomycetota bacterium]